jgi:MYXO-CTERM domain-containing protein
VTAGGGLIDQLAGAAAAAVGSGGGAALALVMLAENVFPPIPSEAVLPVAGYAVAAGQMHLATALLAATTGSVAGALVLYAAGRFGGRPLLYRYRWLLRLDEAQLDRADAWFDRRGPALVFWARMIPLARSAVSVPAGISQMPVGRFLALTAAGSLAWNSLLIGAGMLLGERWHQVSAAADTYGGIVLAVAAVGLAVVLLRAGHRRRRRG